MLLRATMSFISCENFTLQSIEYYQVLRSWSDQTGLVTLTNINAVINCKKKSADELIRKISESQPECDLLKFSVGELGQKSPGSILCINRFILKFR